MATTVSKTGKVLSGAGLRGQVAGKTSLSTVGVEGSGLTYRGYDIRELSMLCNFEEVAHLLLQGELPNAFELAQFQRDLQKQTLPEPLLAALKIIPASANPMDVIHASCALLGCLQSETDFREQYECAQALLSKLPRALNYWYQYSHHQLEIDTNWQGGDYSLARHFLEMLQQAPADSAHVDALNASLILYAEHEFNASTFAARVCASTLSDIYSSVGAAIGTLRGPLHGGANEAALVMLQSFADEADAEQKLLEKIANKQTIMGFGHAIYRTSDPRSDIIKCWAEKLCKTVPDKKLLDIAKRCEQVMAREKSLFCNADFFHAPAYSAMSIPAKLFTPLFVCARLSGWCAHIFEQRSDNRIIRPSAEYIGHSLRPVTALKDRSPA